MRRILFLQIFILLTVLIFIKCKMPYETKQSEIVVDTELITSEGGEKYHPTWSPDGEKLLLSLAEHTTEFKLYSLDGSECDTVVINKPINGYPIFSHDGKFAIIFFKNDPSTYFYSFEEDLIRILPLDKYLFHYPTIWDSDYETFYTYNYQDGQNNITIFTIDGDTDIYPNSLFDSIYSFSVTSGGTSIVCHARLDTTYGIWLINENNRELIFSQNDSVSYRTPLISPDGKYILYDQNGYESGLKLYSLVEHSVISLEVTGSSIYAFKWGNNSDDIYLYTRGYQRDIWKYSVATNSYSYVCQTTAPIRHPDWFPEENRVYRFYHTNQYFINEYDINTNEFINYPDLNSAYDMIYIDPMNFLYTTPCEICSYSINLGLKTVIVTWEDIPEFASGGFTHISMSPSRNTIAFDYGNDIFLYNLNEKSLTHLNELLNISQLTEPTWSPDENMFACMVFQNRMAIIEKDDNGEYTILKQIQGKYNNIDWRPVNDVFGSYILFNPSPSDGYGISMINVETQEIYKIIDDPYNQHRYYEACWSPAGTHIAFIVDRENLYTQKVFTDLTDE